MDVTVVPLPIAGLERNHSEMSADEFRFRLQSAGFNLSSFTRWMIEQGDYRPFKHALKAISRYACGVTPVPPELIVILRQIETYGIRGDGMARRPGPRPRLEAQL